MSIAKITVSPAVAAHEIFIENLAEKVLSTGVARLVKVSDPSSEVGSMPRLAEVGGYLRRVGLRGATKAELEEFFQNHEGGDICVIGTGSYHKAPPRWDGYRMVEDITGRRVYAFCKSNERGENGVIPINAIYYYSGPYFLGIVL